MTQQDMNRILLSRGEGRQAFSTFKEKACLNFSCNQTVQGSYCSNLCRRQHRKTKHSLTHHNGNKNLFEPYVEEQLKYEKCFEEKGNSHQKLQPEKVGSLCVHREEAPLKNRKSEELSQGALSPNHMPNENVLTNRNGDTSCETNNTLTNYGDTSMVSTVSKTTQKTETSSSKNIEIKSNKESENISEIRKVPVEGTRDECDLIDSNAKQCNNLQTNGHIHSQRTYENKSTDHICYTQGKVSSRIKIEIEKKRSSESKIDQIESRTLHLSQENKTCQNTQLYKPEMPIKAGDIDAKPLKRKRNRRNILQDLLADWETRYSEEAICNVRKARQKAEIKISIEQNDCGYNEELNSSRCGVESVAGLRQVQEPSNTSLVPTKNSLKRLSFKCKVHALILKYPRLYYKPILQQKLDIPLSNISRLKPGVNFYIMRKRYMWYKCQILSRDGNTGIVREVRSRRDLDIEFKEDGNANSPSDLQVSRWALATGGLRNVGINLIGKWVDLDSCNGNSKANLKVHKFDVTTGFTECYDGNGNHFNIIFKDNGEAYSLDGSFMWYFSPKKCTKSDTLVGKTISLFDTCSWRTAKIESYSKPEEIYILSTVDGTKYKAVLYENGKATNSNGIKMRWRQKFWPESENRNHNQDPYEQRKLNNSKNLHGNLLEIKDTGTREFSSSLEKEGSELAKSVQPVPFRLGDLVRVSERSLKGVYKQGGISRVCSLNRDGTFDVKFHIGGRRTEKRVLPYFIHKYDMYGGVEAVQEHFIFCENEEEKLNNSFSDSETNIEESPEYNPSFVRRSMRRPGLEQMRQPNTRRLFDLLKGDVGTATDIRVLRLKNFLEADTNSLVILETLRLLKQNNTVQALYIHNFNNAIDDSVLLAILEMLQANNNIWALNVGENFRVTNAGWHRFAEGLKSTHITHLYAGSESTVNGALKVYMRDIIRQNRRKHTKHCDPENLEVIVQIGQMWWNPRNARCLRPFLDCEFATS